LESTSGSTVVESEGNVVAQRGVLLIHSIRYRRMIGQAVGKQISVQGQVLVIVGCAVAALGT